jgi:hypothetical protein
MNIEKALITLMNKMESSLSSDKLQFLVTLRGLTVMMLPSGLLKPIAVAGNQSVTRFTQSSWTYKVVSRDRLKISKLHTYECDGC